MYIFPIKNGGCHSSQLCDRLPEDTNGTSPSQTPGKRPPRFEVVFASDGGTVMSGFWLKATLTPPRFGMEDHPG